MFSFLQTQYFSCKPNSSILVSSLYMPPSSLLVHPCYLKQTEDMQPCSSREQWHSNYNHAMHTIVTQYSPDGGSFMNFNISQCEKELEICLEVTLSFFVTSQTCLVLGVIFSWLTTPEEWYWISCLTGLVKSLENSFSEVLINLCSCHDTLPQTCCEDQTSTDSSYWMTKYNILSHFIILGSLQLLLGLVKITWCFIQKYLKLYIFFQVYSFPTFSPLKSTFFA